MAAEDQIIEPYECRVDVFGIHIMDKPFKAVENQQYAYGRENEVIKEAQQFSIFFACNEDQLDSQENCIETEQEPRFRQSIMERYCQGEKKREEEECHQIRRSLLQYDSADCTHQSLRKALMTAFSFLESCLGLPFR